MSREAEKGKRRARRKPKAEVEGMFFVATGDAARRIAEELFGVLNDALDAFEERWRRVRRAFRKVERAIDEAIEEIFG